MEYPTITVRWADHWCERGDFDVKDIEENVKSPYVGEFTGKLVAESKQMIAIVSNVWEDGTVSDPMYIMKRAIITRTDREAVE
ncbi:MAG: hypothetical protein PVI03_02520 [Candidatus Thorarchaeota archaeon]|jgi:hypothetical protein